MDINIIEQKILSKPYKKSSKCTMFGINLGLELNQRLTDYASKKNVSKASIVKNLLTAYLDEKENN
jgi:predicted DNA-binding protein